MSLEWPNDLEQDGITRTFPVNGQGTFIYSKQGHEKFGIVVTPDFVGEKLAPDTQPDSFIALVVNDDTAQFVIRPNKDSPIRLLASTPAQDSQDEVDFGTEKEFLSSYWLSYDRDAFVLKYGKGYRMVETTLLEYNYKADYLKYIDPTNNEITEDDKKAKKEECQTFFNPSTKKFVLVMLKKDVVEKEKEEKEESPNTFVQTERTFQFEPNPLVGNCPPVILDSSKVTLFDLDRNQYMLSASLPGACLELYSNVKGLELEYPVNPVLSLTDAIRYSMETPGKHLNNILESKKGGEFDGEDEVYIRVTCGPEQASGPGIPYVLELWPKQCRSPIHNHGGSCAVIKVLHGQIQITVYNKGTNPPKPADEILRFDAKQGQCTWMGPNWYQRHELKNTTNDYCATIQCYRYDNGDKIHWPGFDFVEYDEDGEATDHDTFFPNSDGNFQSMRAIVLKEYEDFLYGITEKN